MAPAKTCLYKTICKEIPVARPTRKHFRCDYKLKSRHSTNERGAEQTSSQTRISNFYKVLSSPEILNPSLFSPLPDCWSYFQPFQHMLLAKKDWIIWYEKNKVMKTNNLAFLLLASCCICQIQTIMSDIMKKEMKKSIYSCSASTAVNLMTCCFDCISNVCWKNGRSFTFSFYTSEQK